MDLYHDLLNKDTAISLIGLGYVGLPIAVSFASHANVTGYDINPDKIELFQRGMDPTKEVGDRVLSQSTVNFTSDPRELQNAKFHIVAVPTPLNSDRTPNLTPLIAASKTLAENLTKGSIVVYESTVYPGVTENICIPILENHSGLSEGIDFHVGYSPERINPGDTERTLENIVKVVSARDPEALEVIAKTYELVVKAGVYKAETIQVAEAAKIIENAQRDINIAFMNELAIIFSKLGINTKSVLEAASTKWNFLNFYPGLVGGHCIGIDPYYLAYRAEEVGHHPDVILAGRRINDSMGFYIVQSLVKLLIKAKTDIRGARVAILGLTFKENTPDTRNTRVIDMVKELNSYGIEPIVVDPLADQEEVMKEYGIELSTRSDLAELDAIILAVSHREFTNLTPAAYKQMFRSDDQTKKVFVDVRSIYNSIDFEEDRYIYWSL